MKKAVREIWNANAEFWDRRMGEGNQFHKVLIEPIQLRLLEIREGQNILDVACGNGQFARRMAQLGANVTAIDFSEKFITLARAKSPARIDYRVLDAGKKGDLAKLKAKRFDAIVCTMALMDMEDILPLVSASPALLKKGGIFVFSLLHPCFNSGETTLVHEQDDLARQVENRYYVKVRRYLDETRRLGIGMLGQPEAQYYFHRPISSLLKPFFEAGLVLDAFEEPAFPDSAGGSIFHQTFTRLPAALVCRLRLRQK
jgi:SAM-dependent methyltransferase